MMCQYSFSCQRGPLINKDVPFSPKRKKSEQLGGLRPDYKKVLTPKSTPKVPKKPVEFDEGDESTEENVVDGVGELARDETPSQVAAARKGKTMTARAKQAGTTQKKMTLVCFVLLGLLVHTQHRCRRRRRTRLTW